MDKGNFDHSPGRRYGNFIILAEMSGMVEPGEDALNHPAPRKLFPLVWLEKLYSQAFQ